MIFVKLKDPSSILHDPSQGVTIEGKKTFKVKRTSVVNNALRGGAIVISKESDYKKSNPIVKTAKNPVEKEVKDSNKKLDNTNKGNQNKK